MLLKRAHPTQRDLDRTRTLSRKLVGQHTRHVSREGSSTVLRSGRVCTAIEVALLPTASTERADLVTQSCQMMRVLHASKQAHLVRRVDCRQHYTTSS
jgi:hypothetical protein